METDVAIKILIIAAQAIVSKLDANAAMIVQALITELQYYYNSTTSSRSYYNEQDDRVHRLIAQNDELSVKLAETQNALERARNELRVTKEALASFHRSDDNVRETVREIVGGYPSNEKISMIKAVRAFTHWGLKEAKDAVEAALNGKDPLAAARGAYR